MIALIILYSISIITIGILGYLAYDYNSYCNKYQEEKELLPNLCVLMIISLFLTRLWKFKAK